jgi:hypothetical protein
MGEEKLEFSRSFLVLGNLGLLAWIFLASISVLLYNQLYGWLYLVFLALMVYAVLRRLGCSSCYLCKACTSGFGRLAGDFFGRGFVKKESMGNRLSLVVFTYALLVLVPVTLLSLSPHGFSYVGVFVLICLLVISVYSLATWFNRAVVKKV